MNRNKLSPPEKWILIGIPLLFVIGALLHFAYDVLGESPIVGLFAPVNESIWEHAKMVVWPIILWWGLYYRFRGEAYKINPNKWFAGALTSLLVALIAMPMLYYFYTEAFGVEIVWVDVLILLLALLFGQLLGLHAYRYSKGIPVPWAFAAFGGIILLFFLFPFFPPQIPWFQDGITGSYGIDFPL